MYFFQADEDSGDVVNSPIANKRTSLYVPSTGSQESSDSHEEAFSLTPLQQLNLYLAKRDVSPIRNTLKTPWDQTSDRTKRRHTRKARQAIQAIIKELSPDDPSRLWFLAKEDMSMKGDLSDQDTFTESAIDTTLIEALAECYNNAAHWGTRRQILSIMVDKVSLTSLRRWIPDLTRYRFNIAKNHLLLNGRGTALPDTTRTRMCVPLKKLEHFLDFITSSHAIQELPFGKKSMKLSTGDVIVVPNVIRTIIPERIVQQYQSFCSEAEFSPLSRSSLHRILSVCSASSRKSLQGIDNFKAAGAKAFDDLEELVDSIGDSEMGMSWAKSQKENLRLSKRYLKGDYKVSFDISGINLTLH
jgi:hypothetical protein